MALSAANDLRQENEMEGGADCCRHYELSFALFLLGSLLLSTLLVALKIRFLLFVWGRVCSSVVVILKGQMLQCV